VSLEAVARSLLPIWASGPRTIGAVVDLVNGRRTHRLLSRWAQEHSLPWILWRTAKELGALSRALAPRTSLGASLIRA